MNSENVLNYGKGRHQSMSKLSFHKVGVTEMRTTFAVVVLVAFASSAYAADALRPSQAMANQGQLVIIEGTADIQNDSSNSGINVKVTGSDNSHLTAFIPIGAESMFPTLDSYNGKIVDVTGVVDFEFGRTHDQVDATKSDKACLALNPSAELRCRSG